MDNPMPDEQENENKLSSIFKGMDVYDVEGDKVGTVDYVYMGSNAGSVRGAGVEKAFPPPDVSDTITDPVAAIAPSDNIPDEEKNRMFYEGFIRVESGSLFSRDRFILPDQIDMVDGNRVILNTRHDDLIHK